MTIRPRQTLPGEQDAGAARQRAKTPSSSLKTVATDCSGFSAPSATLRWSADRWSPPAAGERPQVDGLLRHLHGTAEGAGRQGPVASRAVATVQRGDPDAEATIGKAVDRLQDYKTAAIQMVLDLNLTLQKFEALIEIDEPWVTGWALFDAGLEFAEAAAIGASDEWEGKLTAMVKILKVASSNVQRVGSQGAKATAARGTATRAEVLQMMLRSSSETIDLMMAAARTDATVARYWATAPTLVDTGPSKLASMVSDKIAFNLVAKLFTDHGAKLVERRTNRWYTQIMKNGADAYERSKHYAVVRARHDNPRGNFYIDGDPAVGYLVEDYDPPGINMWYEPDATISWKVTRVEGVSEEAMAGLLDLMVRAGIRKASLMDPSEATAALEFEDNTEWLPIWIDASARASGGAEAQEEPAGD